MTTVTLEFDDVAYDNFTKEVGTENICQVFNDFVKNYPLHKNMPTHKMADYRLGGLPPFHVPDDFDKYEFPEFYENLDKFTDKSKSDKNSNIDEPTTGAFDKFFGILKSGKSVSLEEMNEAIRQRGGKL